MKTRIVYQKVYLDPPLTHARIMASERVEGDGVARMNQLASYTSDTPYIPADAVHGLRWFSQAISLTSED
jgi:hypothetical protein